MALPVLPVAPEVAEPREPAQRHRFRHVRSVPVAGSLAVAAAENVVLAVSVDVRNRQPGRGIRSHRAHPMQRPRIALLRRLFQPDDVRAALGQQHVEPGIPVEVEEGEHEPRHSNRPVVVGHGDLDPVLAKLDL